MNSANEKNCKSKKKFIIAILSSVLAILTSISLLTVITIGIDGLSYRFVKQMLNNYDISQSDNINPEYMTALLNAVESMNEDEILQELTSTTNSDLFKTLLMESCTSRLIQIKPESLISIFHSSTTCLQLRLQILMYLNDCTNISREQFNDTLSSIIHGDDKTSAQFALRILAAKDPIIADSLIGDVFSDFNGKLDSDMLQLFLVKASTLKAIGTEEDKGSFINHCSFYLDEAGKKKDQETVISYCSILNTLHDKRIMSVYVYSPFLDREEKMGRIGLNTDLLIRLVDEAACAEGLRTVADAMLIAPLNQLKEPLENVLASKKYAIFRSSDPELTDLINNALQAIRTNGSDSI